MDGAKVILIGCGDAGLRIADGLLRQGGVRHLVLANLNIDRLADQTVMLDSCHEARVTVEEIDGRDKRSIEALLKKHPADLIVQSGSLMFSSQDMNKVCRIQP